MKPEVSLFTFLPASTKTQDSDSFFGVVTEWPFMPQKYNRGKYPRITNLEPNSQAKNSRTQKITNPRIARTMLKLTNHLTLSILRTIEAEDLLVHGHGTTNLIADAE